ncbi:MAG TPA: hypothetical protein VEL75_22830 [Candidatus Methylomirabilis sp.]|nr:hypothetical protein [Candidatus Methylomirabilis sp.]
MEPLAVDALRALARARGLELTEPELEGLLPLVEAARSMMESLRGAGLEGIEPACQYRIL